MPSSKWHPALPVTVAGHLPSRPQPPLCNGGGALPVVTQPGGLLISPVGSKLPRTPGRDMGGLNLGQVGGALGRAAVCRG